MLSDKTMKWFTLHAKWCFTLHAKWQWQNYKMTYTPCFLELLNLLAWLYNIIADQEMQFMRLEQTQLGPSSQ